MESKHINKLQGEIRAARSEISKLHRQMNTISKTVARELASVKQHVVSAVPREEPHPALQMKAIGRIESPFVSKNGTPRQPGLAPSATSRLRVEWGTNPDHSIANIESFSHLWLLWVFDRNGSEVVKAKVKPPRLEGDLTGLFACRTPHRPNPIGEVPPVK